LDGAEYIVIGEYELCGHRLSQTSNWGVEQLLHAPALNFGSWLSRKSIPYKGNCIQRFSSRLIGAWLMILIWHQQAFLAAILV